MFGTLHVYSRHSLGRGSSERLKQPEPRFDWPLAGFGAIGINPGGSGVFERTALETHTARVVGGLA